MLSTTTTTYQPATDTGYPLHENPARLQTVKVSGGQAQVFYLLEVTAERYAVSLLLDLYPIGLVRGKGGAPSEGFAPEQYVPSLHGFVIPECDVEHGPMHGTCKDCPASTYRWP